MMECIGRRLNNLASVKSQILELINTRYWVVGRVRCFVFGVLDEKVNLIIINDLVISSLSILIVE
jgi:hypothetical protein